MGVDRLGSSDWTSATRGKDDTSTNSTSKEMSEFFSLLLAQMKYQDPMEPMSNQEMMAQFAQLTTVQELQKMTSAVEDMTASSALSNASNLIGKTIVATDDNDNSFSGEVQMVMVGDNNKISLVVDGEKVNLEYVDVVYGGDNSSQTTSLEQITATNTLSYASSLIGKYIESKVESEPDEKGKTTMIDVNGIVDSVEVTDERVSLIVGDYAVALGNISRVMANPPAADEDTTGEDTTGDGTTGGDTTTGETTTAE